MFELDQIKLDYYDSKNIKHELIKKEFLDQKSPSFSKYIKQIDERLVENDKNTFSLDYGYLVYLKDEIVGYLFISDIKKYKIYVEYSILAKYRKKGIGKLLLTEITDFLINNYQIKEIALDIDVSNIPSINLAESCGYYMEEEFDKNTATNSKEFTYINPYFYTKNK